MFVTFLLMKRQSHWFYRKEYWRSGSHVSEDNLRWKVFSKFVGQKFIFNLQELASFDDPKNVLLRQDQGARVQVRQYRLKCFRGETLQLDFVTSTVDKDRAITAITLKDNLMLVIGGADFINML